tara:strand:+ start:153 stop:1424 length:1272 start_codon:yes stop_codon:yes gene_type:complete
VSKNKMEDRIIAYLLGECEEEEAFEVEKLCREDSKWQAEKIRYGQVLGLLEESIVQTPPELSPEKEMKLTEEQRKEIKSLLDKDSEISKAREDEVIVDENKNDRKEDGMTEKENKDNKSKVIYWAPLAAAAVAAIIAYWGNPEKEAEKTSIASASKVESDKLETNASPAVVSSFSDQQTFSADAEIALQDAISDSANEALALRTTSEIKEMEKANFNALPDGKELAATLMKAKKVTDGNSSDLLIEKEGEGATDLAAAFSLPVPNSTSRIPSDLVSNNESAIVRKRKATEAINPDKILNATVETKDDLNPEGKNSWHTLFKEPEESFIFSEKGDSLGKIKIIESSAGEFVFIRTNWPNKNRNFILEPGTYEIRLSKKETGTIILEGSIEAPAEEQKYKFKISEAWELDKDEKRNPVPIENLNP